MIRRSLLTACVATSALLAPQVRLRPKVLTRASDDEAPEVEEDWRAFRARLVAGGIPVVTTDEEAEAPPPEARQGLDEDNFELASSQSKRAGDMLREGTWAHEVGAPEVGGLLLRLPLETQLAVAKDSHWGRELRAFAKQERTRAAMEEVTTAAIFTMGCVVRASMRYVGVANRGKSPFEAARRVWIKSISPVLNKWHDESLIFYLRLWAIFR